MFDILLIHLFFEAKLLTIICLPTSPNSRCKLHQFCDIVTMQPCHTLRILPSHCHFPWAVSTAAGSVGAAAAASVVGPYAGSLSPSRKINKKLQQKRHRPTDTDRPCDLMGILVVLSVFCILPITGSLHAASVQSIWICWKKSSRSEVTMRESRPTD